MAEEAALAEEAIADMEKTVLDAGWDGEWFLRAYDHYKNKIGSKECEDGKIYIEPQGFCVMAEIGLKEGNCLKAMESVEKNIWIPNTVLYYCSHLITDIMLSSVKSLLIHQDTKRMPVFSVTTTHGSPLQKLLLAVETVHGRSTQEPVRHISKISVKFIAQSHMYTPR